MKGYKASSGNYITGKEILISQKRFKEIQTYFVNKIYKHEKQLAKLTFSRVKMV